MNDLMIIYLCCSQPATGTLNILPPNRFGSYIENRINGRKIRLEKKVFKNNTGSTALSFSDFFLNTS